MSKKGFIKGIGLIAALSSPFIPTILGFNWNEDMLWTFRYGIGTGIMVSCLLFT